MINDADKKVEKAKKKREGIYESSQHPEHFSNEGNEYVSDPEPGDNNDMKENLDYDKVKGIKK